MVQFCLKIGDAFSFEISDDGPMKKFAYYLINIYVDEVASSKEGVRIFHKLLSYVRFLKTLIVTTNWPHSVSLVTLSLFSSFTYRSYGLYLPPPVAKFLLPAGQAFITYCVNLGGKWGGRNKNVTQRYHRRGKPRYVIYGRSLEAKT